MAQHTIILNLDAEQEAGLAWVAGGGGGDLYIKSLMENATRDYYRQAIDAKVALIHDEVKLGTAAVVADVDAAAIKAQAARDAREGVKADEEPEPEPVAVRR